MKRSKSGGFTLMEFMISMVLLACIVGVAAYAMNQYFGVWAGLAEQSRLEEAAYGRLGKLEDRVRVLDFPESEDWEHVLGAGVWVERMDTGKRRVYQLSVCEQGPGDEAFACSTLVAL